MAVLSNCRLGLGSTYAPVNVTPQGRGGGGYPREFDSATFPLGRVFDTWAPPLGREFDMAAILEGRENLEMRRREAYTSW